MYKNHEAALKTSIVGLLLVLGLIACKNDTGAAEALEVPAQEATVVNSEKTGDLSMDQFTARLEKARPGLSVVGVVPTDVENIVRVDLNGGRPLYAIKGTDYFFVGELYQVQDEGLVNVSEQEKVGVRKELLAQIPVKDMIVFSPEGEVKKHISVFTDVDCGYCQKLHQEVPELNAMGIEVRYMAFPRAGLGSPSYEKIASAWCSDKPQEALTKLKNREQIPTNVCDGNPVAAQYNLGQQMGVSGTPTIIFEDGESVPGYLPAQDLAARLGI